VQFNNSRNVPRSQRPDKNVFNCCLNCSKFRSVYLRWTGKRSRSWPHYLWGAIFW